MKFFVDVFFNKEFDQDTVATGFATVQAMVYGAEGQPSVADTPENRKQVLEAIERLMKADNASNRWETLEMMHFLGDLEGLDKALAGWDESLPSFVYFPPEEPPELPDVYIGEFCRKMLVPKADKARAVLEGWLPKGDAVQRTTAVLCLKILGQKASIDKLEAIKADTKSLEYFFFLADEREARKAEIAENQRPELTVGVLAQNAIDGINYLSSLEQAVADNKMPAEEAALRREAAITVIDFVGEQYAKAVDLAYQAKIAKDQPTNGNGGADRGAKDGGGDGK